MKQVNRILVPTDFSPAADYAMECAKVLASANNATIFLLFVDDEPLLNAPTTSQAYRDKYEDEMALKFDGLFSRKERERYDVHFAVKNGDVTNEVLDYVDANDIDLIVIGTHGHSAVMQVLLGSVAQKIMQRSKIPVVSVRQPVE